MSNETVQGVVEKINKNNNGFYGVLMGDEWYGAGKYEPKFKEGDEVSFEYSMNGKYRNMEFKTVSILEEGKGTPPAKAASSGGGATNWDLKDKRITYLASRKDAIEIARLAIDKDALTLPAKKADRLEVIMGFVDELTNSNYEAIYGESFRGE